LRQVQFSRPSGLHICLIQCNPQFGIQKCARHLFQSLEIRAIERGKNDLYWDKGHGEKIGSSRAAAFQIKIISTADESSKKLKPAEKNSAGFI